MEDEPVRWISGLDFLPIGRDASTLDSLAVRIYGSPMSLHVMPNNPRGFFYSRFTPMEFGCIAELESALRVASDDGFEVKAIRMGPQAMMEFQKCVIEASTGVNSYVFTYPSTANSVLGGFLVTGYRDRYTGRVVSIQVDGSLTDGCFVLDPDVSEHIPFCECPKCKPRPPAPEPEPTVLIGTGGRRIIIEGDR